MRDDIVSELYHALFSAPPCGSFCANRGFGPGPRVLRGAELPDLFGLPHLEPHEKETVRIGTLLALRTAEASKLMWSQGRPFGTENPARRAGTPSSFRIPDVLELDALEGVDYKWFVQCPLGARTTKPTEIQHFVLDVSDLPTA